MRLHLKREQKYQLTVFVDQTFDIRECTRSSRLRIHRIEIRQALTRPFKKSQCAFKLTIQLSIVSKISDEKRVTMARLIMPESAGNET